MILFLLLSQVDSLSLDEAIDIAFSKSPTYYESKVSLDQSRILFYQSLSSLLPTISVTADYTKGELVTSYGGVATSNYSGSAYLNVPIFDVDVISSIFVAGRNLKGTRIQHRANVSNMILQLKTAYYNLINTHNILQSTEITI